MSIWYGDNVPDEDELRLCGDLAGKRVIELGIAPRPNAIAIASAGAKTIVADPSADNIAALRTAAEEAEVRIEYHHCDLADLGFATSGSVDVVIAAHTLGGVDDLPRMLRQVHRVLKPGAPFVAAITHPVAEMFDGEEPSVRRPYGSQGLTFSGLFTVFDRSNFRFDVLHELADRHHRDAGWPAVLVLRARKQGV
ncbi:MAG: class I SAM-dependent methyltransferase [Ilumatobacteraceae bacterium]